MQRFSHTLVLLLFLFSSLIFTACTDEETARVTHDEIIKEHKIHRLKDNPFYLHAQTPYAEERATLILKQFDLIFTGANPDRESNGQITGEFIPGLYTHMLLYIGQDSDGFAYGVEMTGTKDAKVKVEENGTVSVGGQLYIYCIGNNNGEECPKTDFTWGVLLHSDHMWAKSLAPTLYTKLKSNKTHLLDIIKSDLANNYPFQLPIKITLTFQGNYVDIINDGRENGADCTDYIAQLFEESAGVCMNDIYIDAKSLTDYFIHDPQGQKVYLGAENNPYATEDAYIYELLGSGAFTLRDNIPRQTACTDKRKVVGIPIPDKTFKSSSLVDVPRL